MTSNRSITAQGLLCLLTTLFVWGTSPVASVAQPQKADLQEKIMNLRKVKLLEVLELQGNEVEKFFSVFNTYEKRHVELRRSLEDASRDLKRAIDDGASESELRTHTTKVRTRVASMEELVEERFNAIEKVLSPSQYARYVLFETRFRDELQQMLVERMRTQNRDRRQRR